MRISGSNNRDDFEWKSLEERVSKGDLIFDELEDENLQVSTISKIQYIVQSVLQFLHLSKSSSQRVLKVQDGTGRKLRVVVKKIDSIFKKSVQNLVSQGAKQSVFFHKLKDIGGRIDRSISKETLLLDEPDLLREVYSTLSLREHMDSFAVREAEAFGFFLEATRHLATGILNLDLKHSDYKRLYDYIKNPHGTLELVPGLVIKFSPDDTKLEMIFSCGEEKMKTVLKMNRGVILSEHLLNPHTIQKVVDICRTHFQATFTASDVSSYNYRSGRYHLNIGKKKVKFLPIVKGKQVFYALFTKSILGFGAYSKVSQAFIIGPNNEKKEAAVAKPLYGFDPKEKFNLDEKEFAALESPFTQVSSFHRSVDYVSRSNSKVKQYAFKEKFSLNAQKFNATNDEALKILWSLSQAVAHIHKQGCAHGDIKPGNILVQVEGAGKNRLKKAVLADFEGAFKVDKKGRAVNLVRPVYTDAFTPSNEPLSQRSDLYSIGATMFALFGGEQKLKEDGELYRLYQNLSSKNPAERMSATALAKKLTSIMTARGFQEYMHEMNKK